MGTIVYIDGFNFYYGALKETEHKWLDLEKFSQELLRGHQITAIKFFTAIVNDRDDDPNQSQRQHIYLRALGTLPKVTIYKGNFKTRPKTVKLVSRGGKKRKYVEALVTEEKGTDVSLGAHLVYDACHDSFDAAMVISNDSDLETPLQMAVDMGKKVIVVNPHRHHDQPDHLFGNERRNIQSRHLRNSQFPKIIEDSKGRKIHKPQEWL